MFFCRVVSADSCVRLVRASTLVCALFALSVPSHLWGGHPEDFQYCAFYMRILLLPVTRHSAIRGRVVRDRPLPEEVTVATMRVQLASDSFAR